MRLDYRSGLDCDTEQLSRSRSSCKVGSKRRLHCCDGRCFRRNSNGHGYPHACGLHRDCDNLRLHAGSCGDLLLQAGGVRIVVDVAARLKDEYHRGVGDWRSRSCYCRRKGIRGGADCASAKECSDEGTCDHDHGSDKRPNDQAALAERDSMVLWPSIKGSWRSVRTQLCTAGFSKLC